MNYNIFYVLSKCVVQDFECASDVSCNLKCIAQNVSEVMTPSTPASDRRPVDNQTVSTQYDIEPAWSVVHGTTHLCTESVRVRMTSKAIPLPSLPIIINRVRLLDGAVAGFANGIESHPKCVWLLRYKESTLTREASIQLASDVRWVKGIIMRVKGIGHLIKVGRCYRSQRSIHVPFRRYRVLNTN